MSLRLSHTSAHELRHIPAIKDDCKQDAAEGCASAITVTASEPCSPSSYASYVNLFHPGTTSHRSAASATQFDPYVPFADDGVDEKRILTARAVVTGCVLGTLVNASNLYVGLKTGNSHGWTFSANLLGSILGFAILKFCSKTFSPRVPFLGGSFGPKENAIVQTVATSAGGLGGLFTSVVPALFQLGIFRDPIAEFPKLITLTFVTSYYGIMFAVPLRKFFIVTAARDLKLVFPTALATALAIRSMHSMKGQSGKLARRRPKVLMTVLIVCMVYRIGAAYIPGILWDWHIFTWFFIWSGYQGRALEIDNWGWLLEWTPAFIGSGMLVTLNTALSYFGGSVLAWGIIGPILVATGAAQGMPVVSKKDPHYEKWHTRVSYTTMFVDDPTHISPRYWLMWPGVVMMICASVAEIAVHYKMIWRGLQSIWWSVEGLRRNFKTNNSGRSHYRVGSTVNSSLPDPERVPTLQWGVPLVLVVAVTFIILVLHYHIHPGTSLLAILLGFCFSFLIIQCSGVTDTVPISVAAMASQLITGGMIRTQNLGIDAARQTIIISGAIAQGAASHSNDLVVDFRIGFLLNIPPRLQWYAQAIGSTIAIFVSPCLFILFTKAYPCILDGDTFNCPFKLPSVSTWRAVVSAVTAPVIPFPLSCALFAVCASLTAVGITVLRHNAREAYQPYFPNMTALSLAFVLPQTQYSIAMVIGGLTTHLWARSRWGHSCDAYSYAVAAGMISGESLAGLLLALLEIVGIGTAKASLTIGCPGDIHCI